MAEAALLIYILIDWLTQFDILPGQRAAAQYPLLSGKYTVYASKSNSNRNSVCS